MFECPNCHVDLKKTNGSPGVYWLCPSCGGRAATVSLLRRLIPKDIINQMWQAAWSEGYARKRDCPSCGKLMAEVPVGEGDARFNLDVCTLCQTIWFDTEEYESLPKKMRELSFEERLPPAARQQMALSKVRQIREEAQADPSNADPDWWQWVIGFFGVPVESNAQEVSVHAWTTWITAVIVFVVSIACFADLSEIAQTYGFIPVEYERMYGLTFVSSFFLHAGVFHLLSNLYFLVIFGDNVEEWLGWKKYLMLLVAATVVGNLFHMSLNMESTLPCVGASGGIFGVLTFYALQFPHAKLRVLVGCYMRFGWVKFPAWALFMIWLVFQYFGVRQQLAGLSSVSALAHVGGVMTGFVFWLVSKEIISCSFFKGPVDFTKDNNVYNRNKKG
ncbi:MAG: rhomboid family intramembrane serine protease [Kiritimatiellae bacterium]|jgi:membrane associated rhomboid family serine protease/Zn-finger nucleic acid-binding protein|nr:rhomboid family intramembrane serine protease [Kiritimatiellia bacterium]